jgi:hypothetical protein
MAGAASDGFHSVEVSLLKSYRPFLQLENKIVAVKAINSKCLIINNFIQI